MPVVAFSWHSLDTFPIETLDSPCPLYCPSPEGGVKGVNGIGVDSLLEAFDIRRSLSRKGNPYDNAVIESTNRILKKELVYRRAFADLGQLRRELNLYVRWRNEEGMHSMLGYMSPVEFRNAELSL